MWKRFAFGWMLTVAAVGAQTNPLQFELANLREDMRGLVQRVGELSLRVEQLERDNAALRSSANAAADSYATVNQLNDAVADLNRAIKSASAGTRNEVLQKVAVQMEKLAQQTNSALDSLAKGMAKRAAVQTSFTEDYPKEGGTYIVQRGDTISSIAQKTGTRVQDIVNANKIADPTKLQVGQALFIPGAQ